MTQVANTTRIDHSCYKNQDQDNTFSSNINVWLPYILVAMFTLVKIPHWLWKYLEGGMITSIIGPAGANRNGELIAISFKMLRYL